MHEKIIFISPKRPHILLFLVKGAQTRCSLRIDLSHGYAYMQSDEWRLPDNGMSSIKAFLYVIWGRGCPILVMYIKDGIEFFFSFVLYNQSLRQCSLDVRREIRKRLQPSRYVSNRQVSCLYRLPSTHYTIATEIWTREQIHVHISECSLWQRPYPIIDVKWHISR